MGFKLRFGMNECTLVPKFACSFLKEFAFFRFVSFLVFGCRIRLSTIDKVKLWQREGKGERPEEINASQNLLHVTVGG